MASFPESLPQKFQSVTSSFNFQNISEKLPQVDPVTPEKPASQPQPWLESLNSHPIWTLPGDYKDPAPGSKVQTFSVVRGTELIVAVGNEIRMAHLGEIKGKGNTKGYKILNAPEIDFNILQLIPSPQGKLLAVVGKRRVSVLVLPRRGWNGLVGSRITVKCLLVGQFYHGLSSSPIIAKSSWHPYGTNDSILLVLTTDGMLREYDVTEDADDPAQTTNLCQVGELIPENRLGSGRFGVPSSLSSSFRGQKSRNCSSFWSAKEAGDDIAVSFCFGESKTDWGFLTLYCLFQNGDIYALCPYIPSSGSFPASHFASLSQYITSKLEVAQKALELGEDVDGSSYKADEDIERYRAHLQYVNSIIRKADGMIDGKGGRSRLFNHSKASWQDINQDMFIKISSTELGRAAVRQGPFLLQPAPKEIDSDNESVATDLVQFSYTSKNKTTDESASEQDTLSLGVFLIAYSTGKIDVLLDTDVIEPLWTNPNDEILPTALVYETIDLGINFDNDEQNSHNLVQLTIDPLYSDTIYASHNYGTHCLVLSSWLDTVFHALEQDDMDDSKKTFDNLIRKPQMSEVAWILKALPSDGALPCAPSVAIINNPFLENILLILTSFFQLVSIELNMRVPVTENSEIDGLRLSSKNVDVSAYTTLLTSPFVVPQPLDGQTKNSWIAIPRNLAGKEPISADLTPEHLRFLGQAVQTYREGAQKIATAANLVQGRLELQLREFSRQLSKVEMAQKTREQEMKRAEQVAARLKSASEYQRKLLNRLDKSLQRLMDHHQPDLSYYEQQWLQELDRTSDKVNDDNDGTGRSLKARVARIEEQFDILRKELGRRELSLSTSNMTPAKHSQELGQNQLSSIEEQLGEESQLLVTARQKLNKLFRQVTMAANAL